MVVPLGRTKGWRCSVSIWFLILSNILVFLLSSLRNTFTVSDDAWFAANLRSSLNTPHSPQYLLANGNSSGSLYILDYPRGTAVALPSVRLSKEEDKAINRQNYGGAQDKAHLGGFTEIDLHGISPAVWKHMISYFGIKSLLDVGCGRGISTSWFALHGVDALCVEGSHDAVLKTMLPDPSTQLVEHDFTRGPWWPPQTVDAVWSIELLEHIGRNFHHNYLPAFRKAALIFVTHSQWGGWHHVEVHNELWWISKLRAYGFVYSRELSEMVRRIALDEKVKEIPSVTGEPYNAQHLWTRLIVFINPAVAALPEHAHLFAEHGCFQSRAGDVIAHRECGIGKFEQSESKLPKSWYPLSITDDMDKEWEDLVKRNIKSNNSTS